MSFDLLESYYSGEDKLFQRIMQRNRVALFLWLVIMIFLVRYLCSKRFILKLVMPISNILMPLIACLNVGNINLCIFRNDRDIMLRVFKRIGTAKSLVQYI